MMKPSHSSEKTSMPLDLTQLRQIRHDLGNYVNQIIGYSELLAEDLAELQDSAESIETLSNVQCAATAIQSLVSEKFSSERLTQSLDPAAETSQDPRPSLASLSKESLEIIQSSAHIKDLDHLHRLHHSARILVVDDDPYNRQLLSELLSREGFNVELALDGEEAISKAVFTSYDLILLDILMPGIDGFQVLTSLKSDPRTSPVPVIMISALDDISMVVPCIEAGADDYLPKPFNRVLLRARMSSSLDKKYRHDQELKTYQNLLKTKGSLEAVLSRVKSTVRAFSTSETGGSESQTLIVAIQEIVGTLEAQSAEINQRIQQIEIRINRKSVSSQVQSITNDPSFLSLSERAKLMRDRRRARSAA